MTKHTKAPWHVGMRPGPIIYGPKGEQIADMRFPLLDTDEHMDNVKLIAAGPELYQTAQYIDETVKTVQDFEIMDDDEYVELIVTVKFLRDNRRLLNSIK